MQSLKQNQQGFTFVELLVVIVIIAVLVAATANYLFSQGSAKANDVERKNDLNQIAASIEQFQASYGEPPNPEVKSRKIKGKVSECENVSNFPDLMNCFKALKYIEGEGLASLAEDPKQDIEHPDSGNPYRYLYGADNNAWKLCTLLENQTDPDLNDDYQGSGTYGSEEGDRTYCVMASNLRADEVDFSVEGGEIDFDALLGE